MIVLAMQIMVKEISDLIISTIERTEEIFSDYGYHIAFSKSLAHKMIMAIISPVALNLPNSLQKIQTIEKIVDSGCEQQLTDQIKLKELKELRVEQKPPIEERKKNKKPRKGIRMAFTSEEELKIKEWIIEQARTNKKVTKDTLKLKAKQLKNCDRFSATSGWMTNFLKRHPGIEEFISDYCPLWKKKVRKMARRKALQKIRADQERDKAAL